MFAGAADAAEVQERLDRQIATEVQAVLEATRDCDAFDVIELMRLRELSIAPIAAVLSPDP